MDFLNFAAKSKHNIQPINNFFSVDYPTKSTLNQYNSIFRKLKNFIIQERPEEIDLDFSLSFFRHLSDKGLAAGTIVSTKSALVRIFDYGFGIDLKSHFFSSIPKVVAKRNPPPEQRMIDWSLNKVLKLAFDIDN